MQREKVIELWMKASNANPSGSLDEFARLVELETLEMAAGVCDDECHASMSREIKAIEIDDQDAAREHCNEKLAFLHSAKAIRNLKETNDKE